MELTEKERLAFIFQLRILEKLYPDEATHFAKKSNALEQGFTYEYGLIAEGLHTELSVADCKEVLNILDMYSAITFSLKELAKNDTLRNHHLAKFIGFDGNTETSLMLYVRYYIIDLNRFEELKEGPLPSYNSHMPMLNTYQKMLSRWQGYDGAYGGKVFDLSHKQILAVLGD